MPEYDIPEPPRLVEIRARRAKIGPGAWKLGNQGPTEQHRVLQVDPVDSDRWLANIAEQRDAEFIAHAPGDVDWLVRELVAARGLVAILTEKLARAEFALDDLGQHA